MLLAAGDARRLFAFAAMHRMADRIQARAIRRCGELLKEIDLRDLLQPPSWPT
jgi:hypothetical protein